MLCKSFVYIEGIGDQSLTDEGYKIIGLVGSGIKTKLKDRYEICYVEYEQELLKMLSIFEYNLIILENIMGCKRMHQCIWNIRELYNIPIIVFDNVDAKKELIYAGADIVLDKKCNIDEMQIEIFALMRRWENRQKTRYKLVNISNGKLFFDIDTYNAYWNRQKIGLSRLEFDFLYFLVLTPNRVYTFEQLYQTIWKQIPVGDVQNILWCLVKRIRRKLARIEPEAGNCIVNIRGVGYCFKPVCTAESTN